IPDRYHTVTPYLIVKDSAKAIEFYKQAFNATEIIRMPTPDGKICHAEIRIGNSAVMMADEFPQCNVRSPESLGGTAAMLMIYVEDVDASAARAIAAGAKVL